MAFDHESGMNSRGKVNWRNYGRPDGPTSDSGMHAYEERPGRESLNINGKWHRVEAGIAECPYRWEPGQKASVGKGMGELVNSFEAFTVEPKGMLHDGEKPLPGAIDCLEKLAEAGKPVVLVANYSGRSDAMMGEMERMGFDTGLFAGAVTSGDVGHEYLVKYKHKVGHRAFWIDSLGREDRGLGPFFTDLLEEGMYELTGEGETPSSLVVGEDSKIKRSMMVSPWLKGEATKRGFARSVEKYDGDRWSWRDNEKIRQRERELEEVCAWLDQGEGRADFLLVSGVQSYFNGTSAQTLVNYEQDGSVKPFTRLFKRAISSKLQMLCINPDQEEIQGGKKVHMAGKLAEDYRDMGGEVLYFGKPGNKIFEVARDLLDEEYEVEDNICHVGPKLRSDMGAAANNGLAAVLVDKSMDQEEVQEYCEEEKLWAPGCILQRFEW